MATASRSIAATAERRSAPVYFVLKVYAIAANTFVESIRQPVYGVIIGGAVGLIVVSPYLTMFTLTESEKMIVDMGLATIMLAGLLLAAFTASTVISDEIENKTALTVVSKPVGRMDFILGKFLGVTAGLVVAIYLLSLTLLLTVSGGAMEADIEKEISLWVVLSVMASILISVGYGIHSNFFRDRSFTSHTIGAAIPLFTLCTIVFSFIDPRDVMMHKVSDVESLGAQILGSGSSYDIQVLFGCLLILWSILIMTSLAVAVSTRLAIVVNIVICSIFFIFGLLSDFLFRKTAFLPISQKETLSGSVIVGVFVVAGAALLFVAVRYLPRYVNMIAAAILVAVGVTATLIVHVSLAASGGLSLRQLMSVNKAAGGSMLDMPGSLLLAGGLLLIVMVLLVLAMATSLVLYFVRSRFLHSTLKLAAYATLCLGGATVTSLIAYIAEHVDLGNAKIIGAKVLYTVLPNLQSLWIADLLAVGRGVPFKYVLICGVYSLFHVAAFFLIAVMLFRDRQLA